MRGDVPQSLRHIHTAPSVFPACAGMFPVSLPTVPQGARFPRMRGDVPSILPLETISAMFSPHARGCSGNHHMFEQLKQVFPACAGMFPNLPSESNACTRFPRMRGDVPQSLSKRKANTVFSPHARGCSRLRVRRQLRHHVFPACAGMFLLVACLVSYYDCFPRMRGDVPEVAAYLPLADEFSPHTRGCSDQANHGEMGGRVFPAYAGMFSKGVGSQGNSDPFSPHTRGCSSLQPPNQPCSRGFPRIRGCSVFLGHA